MFLPIFVLIFCIFTSHANADWWKELNFGLTQAQKASKKKSDSPYAEIKRDETANVEFVPLCVDCPEILSLTRAVNQILQAQQHPDLPADSRLPEEIGKLEALYVFTQTETGDCNKRTLGNARFEENDWQFDELISSLIFTQEFSTGKIGAIHFIDGKTRTYIYRVLDEEKNKIIKIIIGPDGVAHVSFWIINPAKNPVAIEKLKMPEGKRSMAEDQLPANYFRLRKGPLIQSNNGIPEDLLLLDFQMRENLIGDFSLETKIYLSARTINARASIVGNQGQEYLYVSANESGTVRVGAPFGFSIPSLAIRGEVSATPETATTEISTKIFGVNTGVLSSTYDYKTQNVALEHLTRPTSKTRLTIRYENNASDDESIAGRENTVWIRFGGSWD